MKIALYANTDWFMYQFNCALALALKAAGHDVLLLTPSGDFHHHFKELGLRWQAVPMQRKSLNIFRELALIIWLAKVLRREKVDLLNNFTLKCVVYGSLASRAASNIRLVNTITGLGYVFTNGELKARLLKPLVHWLLRYALGTPDSKAVVLNEDDFAFVVETCRLKSHEKVLLIPGAGVDCKKFSPSEIRLSFPGDIFRVCLPARLLWDKGLAEFVDASRIVRSKYPDIEFHLCGAIDTGNPTAVPLPVVEEWIEEGAVHWHGHVADMATALPAFDVIVLPSYREGLPTILTEASACGLPLIATDVPGCRDVVIDGVNGFLITKGDGQALAHAVETLYDCPDLRRDFGLNARKIAVQKFSTPVIIEKTLAVYASIHGT